MKAYVCPECRLLISVATDRMGGEALCPGCQSLLHIPGPKDVVASISTVRAAVGDESSLHVNQYDLADWQEDLPVELLAARSTGLPWQMLVPAFVLGSVLLVSLLVLLFSTGSPSEGGIKQPVSAGVASSISDGTKAENLASHPITEAELMTLLNALANVKSVAELMPLVRSDDQAPIEAYYKNRELEFSAPQELKALEPILRQPGFYFFNVDFGAANPRLGVVKRNAKGKVQLDWFSYVGYCEVDWGQLKVQRPKEPTLVRAVRRKIEYYNHGFDSDVWQSFELTYPKSDTILIGYARKDDALVHKLLPLGHSEVALDVVLRIHYPENVPDPRFVIIDELVATDWLVE